jgi:hypothetical protein
MLGRMAMAAGLVCLLTSALHAKDVKVPGKLSGKAFFVTEKPKDVAPEALVKQFEKTAPKAEAKRGKAKLWELTMVAFFKKESVPGPVTIWIFDKADKDSIKSREPVHEFSVDSQPKKVFVHEISLDPDQGYNKDHTYLIQVGQLVQKKERIYATGELRLLK